MIKELTEADLDAWITYTPIVGNKEHGRIKSFNNELQIAWVVYKANGNWDGDHWKEYTSNATNYKDLAFEIV